MSTLPKVICEVIIANITPAAAARLVLMKMLEIATESSAEPNASCDPPLKPNQPSHKMKAPSVASGIDEPGKDVTDPSSLKRPVREPITIAPARAAQPPVEWTRVEPAKSEKAKFASKKPPPHSQEPTIG